MPGACARRPATRISRGAGALTVSASAALAAPSSRASHPSRWRGSRRATPAPERSAPRVERAAAEHRPLRQRGAEEVRHLGVQRTARPRPDRPGRAAEPVDDAPAVDGERGAERPAELEHDERGLGEVDAEPARLVGDAQRGARDLVRGPQVDAVPLAVRRDRRQMDRAGAEHERQPRRDQRAHDRAHPADADAAVRLVLAQQQHQRELALADLLDGNERQPVAGRAEHELERAVAPRAPRPAAPDRRPRRRCGSCARARPRRRRARTRRTRPCPGRRRRDARSNELLGDRVDGVGVEHLVVASRTAAGRRPCAPSSSGRRSPARRARACRRSRPGRRSPSCPRCPAAPPRCSRPAARSSGAAPRSRVAAPARRRARRTGRSARRRGSPRARPRSAGSRTSRPSRCATSRPRGRR